MAAQLDAIDATLAGEPVDPRHAELAELALLLVAGRPAPEPGFAAELDAAVARRFAAPAPARDPGPQSPQSPRPARPPWRDRLRWSPAWLAPLGGLATAGVAAAVAVIVLSGHGSPQGHPALDAAAREPHVVAARRPASGHARSAFSAASGAVVVKSPAGVPAFAANQPASLSPAPVPNGRKVVQSAQLQLSAASDRIDTVAQEVFDVVGREKGYVNSSNVTNGAGGNAQITLSVPSPALAQTMTALSSLPYGSVLSRTDNTQDVNGQYLFDKRKLADDRALRTSLLKQLAAATTQAQIDSLTARIHDAEASIRSDEATLRGLNHELDFSQVSVQINAAVILAHHRRGSSGFTLARAAHDAGRVLTVAAGVALITLAVLVPVGLLGLLAWWIASTVRRRRREQALDLA
jgi:hypothetical protein